jgi:hypothetical protein
MTDYDFGETDTSVTTLNVKLTSVTVFTETYEIKIYPLYGISKISQENKIMTLEYITHYG